MSEPKQRQQDPRTPLEDELAPLPGAPRRVTPALEIAPPWLGPIRHRQQIDRLWLLVVSVLTVTGVMFFGWRGLLSITTVVMAATATYLLTGQVMQMLRPQRPPDSFAHTVVMAGLLGVCLPISRQLALVVLAGFLVGILTHLIGRTHRIRAHPVAMVLVGVWLFPILLGQGTAPVDTARFFDPIDTVLRPSALFFGDVLDAGDQVSRLAWADSGREEAHDAVRRTEPYGLLVDDQETMLHPPSILVNMLGSGELARMQEILFGVTPGAVGGTSRALIILVGLYLMYRKVARPSVGLCAFGAAFLTLLVMPFRDHEQWSIVGARLLDLDPAVAVAYVGYMLLASPLPMIALILAPLTAPMSKAGRVIYGSLIGSLLIVMQWWLGTPYAAYLGLLVASALSRPLDVLHYSPFVGSGTAADE